MSLLGRVALVTGGSRGLGREICIALAAAGSDVMVSSRNEAACAEVAATVRALGRRAAARGCHAGRWSEIDQLVDATYEEFGRVDIVVCNAGKSPLYDSLSAVDEAMFDSVLALNLKGPFRLALYAGTRMAEHGGGSIIIVSSIAAVRPHPESLPYAAAKAGLHAVTRGLAESLAPSVRVNAVVPGAFRTDASRHWSASAWQRNTDAAMLGRIGEPAEICGAVVYLAGDAASYTTGSSLYVDGGIR